MHKLPILLGSCVALALLASGANAQPQYPMANQAAAKVVAKYQNSSCADLAKERQAPPSARKAGMEARAGQLLRDDPQLRAAFVAKVAAPVADKMIVCGFIP
jgi:hypothetical protein